MRGLGWTLAIVVPGTILASLSGVAAASPSMFDKPLKVMRVPLPRDPDNPQSKPMLSCSYYAHFVVKQIDLGEEGAFQLSIVPAGQVEPPCRRENAADEKVVSVDDWTGYFKGVKGDYVFFDADDGWNGGMGFAVFTPAAKKVFDDVAKKWSSVEVTPTGIALRYERVFGASCSLQLNQAACWDKVRHGTGLTQVSPPDCKASYVKEQQRVPKFAQQTLADPTAIDYEVSVSIEGSAHRMSPVTGNALRCRPED